MPVHCVLADQLLNGTYDHKSFKVDYIQLSKRQGYTELKKRLADHLVS